MRLRSKTMSTVDGTFRILESAAGGEHDAPERIHEAAAPFGLDADPIRPDGTVLVHIMRPCAGMGVGRHIYEADMLQREAPKFTGWPMYIDHESPAEVKAKRGLPPSLTKLGGQVLESWWDPDVPAEGRFGQGAVVGKAKPTPWMAQMAREFPDLVGVSMNTFATGTKPRRTQEGVRHVVEGFADDGSIDWVSKAGAGGKIVQVMEAWFEDDAAENEAELTTWLREHRPAVVESLHKPTDGEEDENVDPKQVIEAFDAMDDDGREKVAEAVLASDKGRDVIAEAVDDRLREALPQAMEAAGSAIESQALAKVDQRLGQGDLLKSARARLDEQSGIAEAFVDDAWARISEHQFEPVAPDDKGEGGKTAQQVMESVVDSEVERVKALQEAAGVKPSAKPRRTTVNGNGGGDDEEPEVVREADTRTGGWRDQLQSAGIADPAAAYGISKPDPDKKPEGGGE